jgi:hypothetical protein
MRMRFGNVDDIGILGARYAVSITCFRYACSKQRISATVVLLS